MKIGDELRLDNVAYNLVGHFMALKNRCPWCNGYRRRTQVQNLNETDCISHSTNALGQGINPIILPPAMGK